MLVVLLLLESRFLVTIDGIVSVAWTSFLSFVRQGWLAFDTRPSLASEKVEVWVGSLSLGLFSFGIHSAS